MNWTEINTEKYYRKRVGHSTSEIRSFGTETPTPTDKSTEKRATQRARLTSKCSPLRVLHFPELRCREKLTER